MKYDFSPLILESIEKMQKGLLEDVVPQIIDELMVNPIAIGAADAIYLVQLGHRDTIDAHRTETACLIGYRLRATLINPDLLLRGLVNLTQACLNHKSYEEAYRYGKMAWEINPLDEDLLANMVVICVFTGREQEAVDLHQKLKELSPLHAVNTIDRLKGNQDFKPTYQLSCTDLIEQFSRFLEIGDEKSYRNAYYELLQKPDGIESWKCWRKVCQIHLAAMGGDNEYLKTQETAGLAAASGKAIAFHPHQAEDDWELWYWRGGSLGQMCLYEMAVEALEKSLAINPGIKETRDSLVYCQEMAALPEGDERRPDSKAWVQNRINELKSERKAMYSAFSCPYCGTQKVRLLNMEVLTCDNCFAIDEIQRFGGLDINISNNDVFKDKFLRRPKSDPMAGGGNTRGAAKLTTRAFQAVEIGDFHSARTYLEKALNLDDSLADTHSEYGSVLSHFSDIANAREHFLRALELEPENPKFWINLSKWYYNKGKLDQALKCVYFAEKIDPRYPTIAVARMHIMQAKNAPPAVVEAQRRKAYELYKSRGRKADGVPLSEGEIDRIVNLDNPRARFKPGCVLLILLLILPVLWLLTS